MTTKKAEIETWVKTAPNLKPRARAVSAILGRDGRNGFEKLQRDSQVDIAHLTPLKSSVSASIEYLGDSRDNLDAIEMRNPHSTTMDEISIYGPEKNAETVKKEKKEVLKEIRALPAADGSTPPEAASARASVLQRTSPRSSRVTTAVRRQSDMDKEMKREAERDAEEFERIKEVIDADLPSRWDNWHKRTQDWIKKHGQKELEEDHKLMEIERQNRLLNERLKRLELPGDKRLNRLEKPGGAKYIKSKRKVSKVIKKDVLGKDRNVYKFVGNRKEYIKYKNEFVLLKKYKEIQKKKTKSKKTKK